MRATLLLLPLQHLKRLAATPATDRTVQHLVAGGKPQLYRKVQAPVREETLLCRSPAPQTVRVPEEACLVLPPTSGSLYGSGSRRHAGSSGRPVRLASPAQGGKARQGGSSLSTSPACRQIQPHHIRRLSLEVAAVFRSLRVHPIFKRRHRTSDKLSHCLAHRCLTKTSMP